MPLGGAFDVPSGLSVLVCSVGALAEAGFDWMTG